MCGRFRLSGPISITRDIEPAAAAAVSAASPAANGMISADRIYLPYNDIAVLLTGSDKGQELELTSMYWQLIQPWCNKFASPYVNFNTRVESLNKRHNLELMASNRCLIPVTSFFETKKDGLGNLHRSKEVYEFSDAAGGILMLGGIYSVWHNPGEKNDVRLSCSIITMPPNEIVGAVHPRMPFILTPELCQQWMDPKINETGRLMGMIELFDSRRLVCVKEGA